MTEEEARAWIETRDVPRGTVDTLDKYVRLLVAESGRQNLIAASTIPSLWSRHIVDSAQLAPLLRPGLLVDVGSGAGLPGVVLAVLSGEPVLLVEPRRKRADFLSACVEHLGLFHVSVRCTRVESIVARAASIIARAVASVDALLGVTEHLATPDTRWVLPKGRSVESELAAARETWHGAFRIVASVTDPGSAILVADKVRRKGIRREPQQGAGR